MIYLPDVNIWIALTSNRHVHHQIVTEWLQTVDQDKLAFCRVSELGFLRFRTNAHVLGKDVLSPAQAWRVYGEWRTDDRVVFLSEGADLVRNGGYWDSKSWEVPTPGQTLIWPFLQLTTTQRSSHWTAHSGLSERLISSFLSRPRQKEPSSIGRSLRLAQQQVPCLVRRICQALHPQIPNRERIGSWGEPIPERYWLSSDRTLIARPPHLERRERERYRAKPAIAGPWPGNLGKQTKRNL